MDPLSASANGPCVSNATTVRLSSLRSISLFTTSGVVSPRLSLSWGPNSLHDLSYGEICVPLFERQQRDGLCASPEVDSLGTRHFSQVIADCSICSLRHRLLCRMVVDLCRRRVVDYLC